MANVDKAFGLNPYKGLNVGSAVQQANKYSIDPSGYGTAIYQGDLVIFAGGYINRAAASSANIVGVFSHVYYVATDGTPTYKNYYPASTTALGGGAIDVYVYSTTGVSTRELDSSSINTTQALQLKIVGVVQDDVNGDLGSDNANLVVQINEHAYRGPVAGT